MFSGDRQNALITTQAGSVQVQSRLNRWNGHRKILGFQETA
jgi:hypothetical protein